MKDILFTVESNIESTKDIFCLKLKCRDCLPLIKPGQFLHIEVPDSRLLMRRPFCIYDYTASIITTYYAVVGKGTNALKNAKTGDCLKAILPLGNGFDLADYKKIALFGGGMGCAELFSVTKTSDKEFFAYFGFASKNRVLFLDDFKKTTKSLSVFTDDGSFGEKGYALPALLKDLDRFDAVLACGPLPMIKAAQSALKDAKIPVFVSLEQRMGCGVGACLVCTCKIDAGDGIKHKRVCADGPVFNLKNVVL